MTTFEKYGNDSDIISVIKDFKNLREIDYYEFVDNSYILVIETKDKLILSNCTQEDINALKVLDILNISSAKEIKPFPWWAALILIIVIMIFPYPKKRKNQK